MSYTVIISEFAFQEARQYAEQQQQKKLEWEIVKYGQVIVLSYLDCPFFKVK